MEISKIIKEARIKKGMTQQQLADSVYVTRQTMLGSLGIFAAVYALVAAILLGFMFVARHQLKRRYQNNT